MINVSKEFEQLMNTRTDFKENAIITFLDGTVLELSEKKFTVSNNAIIDGAGVSGLPLGVAIRRHIQIELINDNDWLSFYDFFGAKIRLYLTFELSETVEKIEEGIFTVISPETYGETVIITAVDDMYKADKSYDSLLTYPATAKEVLIDVCSRCDIPLLSTSFPNDGFIISARPDSEMTYAQVIGYIAMISAGNARINRQGLLEILHYNQNAIGTMYDGGSYAPWLAKTDLDGGDFTFTSGDNADGGDFTSANDYHILSKWKSLKVDTDDVVITGITTTVNDIIYQYGTDGYMLSIENPLSVGKEQELVDYIGNQLVGMTFRKIEGDYISNPLIEFMDAAIVVDRKSRIYNTFITDVDFSFFGFTVLRNSAENAVRNSSKYNSESVKAIIKSKKLVEKEKTDREVAIEQLANKLATSSGLYMTIEEQADGSSIYYMHDKPTLSESMVIWKLTALAFAISTDGGKTYPYGFTVDGTTITRLLYAEGIDADYINTGAIQVKDNTGTDIFKVDFSTKTFMWNSKYSALSADGKLTASEVNISGKIKANSGEIGGFTISSDSISHNRKDFIGEEYGIYIGTDGLSIKGPVGQFNVDPFDGTIYTGDIKNSGNLDVSGNVTIDGGFKVGGTSFDSYSSTIGGSYLGFFGAYGSSKAYVSTVNTYDPNIKDVASTLNELIGSLKAYNLIG